MKIPLSTVFAVLLYSVVLPGQHYFETLLPISESTISKTGQDVVFDPGESCYYVLSYAQAHVVQQSSGVPIEGECPLGSTLTKIDISGDTIWNTSWNTVANGEDNIPNLLGVTGVTPAKHLLLSEDGRLILPYSTFFDLNPCEMDENQQVAFADTFIGKIDEINTVNGNLEYSGYLSDTVFCRDDKIVDASIQGDIMHLLVKNDIDDITTSFVLGNDYGVLSNMPLENEPNYYDEISGGLVSHWRQYALILNEQGLLTDSIHFENMEEIFVMEKSWFYDETHFGFFAQGKWIAMEEPVSIVNIYNREGILVYGNTFENRKFKNVQLQNENIIILESLRSSMHSMEEKTIRVSRINLGTGVEACRDYGFPYVEGKKIKLLPNSAFVVLGSSITNVLNAEDRRSNQVYVLVDTFENLMTSIGENSQPKEVNLFPNPVRDYFTISYSIAGIETECILRIFDITGREVLTQQYLIGEKINASSLVSGIYIITVQSKENGFMKGKFIKE